MKTESGKMSAQSSILRAPGGTRCRLTEFVELFIGFGPAKGFPRSLWQATGGSGETGHPATIHTEVTGIGLVGPFMVDTDALE